MKVLVCGGRNFNDMEAVLNALDTLHRGDPITEIAHGGAKGADKLSGVWAHANRIPCRIYPANWGRDGNAAGPIRNVFMLKDFTPDLVVAFPGGKGTAHMVKIARKAGRKVIEVEIV